MGHVVDDVPITIVKEGTIAVHPNGSITFRNFHLEGPGSIEPIVFNRIKLAYERLMKARDARNE